MARPHIWRLAILAALAFLVLPLRASAYISTGAGQDSGWQWENPLPQGNFLLSESFVDATHGWAVGKNGTVLKTSDGGSTWTFQDPGVSASQYSQRDINGVSFADTSHGWIVGSGGLIKHTVDGGSTWTTQTVPAGVSSSTFNAVAAYDANHAVAVGQNYSVVYTTDGGATWNTPTSTGASGSGALYGVAWGSSTTVYAVGDNGTLLRTTNGGTTWSKQTGSGLAGLSASLRGISFSGTTGYIVGMNNGTSSTVLRTTSGTSWTLFTSVASSVPFYAVDLLDTNTCVIVGGNGNVYTTTNAHASTPTWTSAQIAQLSGASLSVNAIALPDSTHLVAVGDCGATFTSADFGATWSTQSTPSTADLLTSWWADANTGWVAGANGMILRTTNAGTSWSGAAVGSGTWRGICFANSTYGYVVGDDGAVYRTVDGGVTWTAQSSGTTDQLNAVWFAPSTGAPSDGIAVGDDGTVLYTTNGGTTWSATRTSVGSRAYYGVYMSDTTHGWMVGERGYIYYTTNGGSTWTHQTGPSGGTTLYAVRGIPGSSNVWTCGSSGQLWSTTNSGTDWTNISGTTGTPTNDLYSVFYTDTSHGWVAGASGTVRYWAGSGNFTTATTNGLPSGSTVSIRSVFFPSTTTGHFTADGGIVRTSFDGGKNWVAQQYGVYGRLSDVAFPTSSAGWVAGAGGVVLASTDGGATWFKQNSGVTTDLYGASFSDASSGFAVGAGGAVRRTVDGGNTWTGQTSGTTNQLNAVATPLGDANHAIAVGNSAKIVRTANGGQTWSTVSAPQNTGNILAVAFPETSTAGIALAACDHTAGNGAPGIIRTTDYGATWSVVSTATQPFYGLDFAPAPNGNVGWACGAAGVVYKTMDMGLSWVAQTSGSPGNSALFDVSAASAQSAFAVGANGVIVQTADGGTRWLPQNSGWGSSGSTASLRGLAFIDASHGFAVGDYGTILRATQQTPPVTTLAADPSSPDGNSGWYRTAPTITLTPDQQADTYYSWDAPSGPFSSYTAPITAPEGAHTLYDYSVNDNGRAEAVKSTAFKVDPTAPSPPTVVTASALDASAIQASFSVPGADSASGIAYYEVWDQVHGSDSPSLATTISVLTSTAYVANLTPNTTYDVWFVARDVAGNASVKSATASAKTRALPALATTALVSPANPTGANGWYVTTPAVSFTVTPAVPADTYWSWDASGSSLYTGPVSAPLGSHTLRFYSVDRAQQREQEAVNTLAFKVDTTPPTFASPISASVLSTSSVDVSWSATDPESGIDHYAVYADGILEKTLTGTSATLTGLAVNAPCDLYVVAFDGAGLPAASDDVIVHTLADPDVHTVASIDPPDPDGLGGWYVTTPTIMVSSLPATLPAWTYCQWDGSDPATCAPLSPFGPPADGIHTLTYYSVDQNDATNRDQARSFTIGVDRTAPSPPASVSAASESTTSIEVTWTSGADPSPGSGLAHYTLYMDDLPSTTTTSTGVTVSGLTPGSIHTFQVFASDVAGNVSLGSPIAEGAANQPPLTTTAVFSPAAPNGMNGWYVTAPDVTFSVSPDVPGDTYYSWDGSPAALATGSVCAPDGTHTLCFWSQDEAHRCSRETTKTLTVQVDSLPNAVTTSPSPAPSMIESAPIVTDTSALLTWTPASEGVSGVDHYEVWDEYVGSTSSTSYLVTGLSPSTSYTFTIRAVNGAGTPFAESNPITLETDPAATALPPSTVAAKAIDGEHVAVDWQPVSAPVGDVSYRLLRSEDGATYSQIATLAGQYETSYLDSALHSSTRYYYEVSSVDDRGESDLSDPAVGDTKGASRAEELGAIEASGAIELHWSASADPAVVGYYVLRSDSSLGAVTTLTPVPLAMLGYEDTVPANGVPYYYSVVGVDASGQLGQRSLELEAKGVPDVSGDGDPHVYSDGSDDSACICHAAHVGLSGQILRFGSDRTVCLGCHSVSTAENGGYFDPLAQSAHGSLDTTDDDPGTLTCLSCHRPVHRADEPLGKLLLTNGTWVCVAATDTPSGPNGFCYRCHGEDSTLAGGDLRAFDDSAHSELATSTDGPVVACDVCHEAHASRNTDLTKYAGFMVCVQCHNSNDATQDLWSQLQADDATGTELPLLPEEQAATGGRIECQNCHNTHAATAGHPLVDPYDPSPSGVWDRPSSDLNEYCFTCHSGEALPTSHDTTIWADPVLASGGATTVANIELAYGTNVHGNGSLADTATAETFLRPDMGYSATDGALDCRACHDVHASSNAFQLKPAVESHDGTKTVSGLAVYPVPSGGYDFRFFCGACHLFDPATHDPLAHTDTTSFPTDCSVCHTHLEDGAPSSGL